MRSGLVALLGLALLPASTQAEQRLMTLETTSRYVDPAKIPGAHQNRPPGTPPRPYELKVNVLLPDGYDAAANKKRRYPVLFLLHGVGDAYDSWAHPGKGDLQNVVPKDFPGIIVMPEADRGFYMDAWNGGRRGEPSWERYHLDELIPLVEQKLRVAPGRKHHAIAGVSMGGAGSAYYASQRPGYFGASAAFSAQLSNERGTYQTGFEVAAERKPEEVYGDPVAQAFYWAGHNPIKLIANLEHTRVYLAAGNGVPGNPEDAEPISAIGEFEFGEQTREFAEAARGRVLDLSYNPQIGTHEWRYTRLHLAGAIRWGLFEDVPEDPARWRFRTVSQRGAAWDYRFEFEQPPDRVQQLEREGDRLSGDGSGSVHLCSKDGGEISAALPFDQPLPKPSRPAKLALPFPSLDRAAAGGVLRARVKPVSGAGKLRVTATARRPKLGARKAKRVTIAARSIGFREGEAKTVKLRVRASGRRLLRELAGEDGRGAARVRVLARSTDCAGNKRARALTKTLR